MHLEEITGKNYKKHILNIGTRLDVFKYRITVQNIILMINFLIITVFL